LSDKENNMSKKSFRNILLMVIAVISYELFGLQSVNDYALIVPYSLLCLLFLAFFLLNDIIRFALTEMVKIEFSEFILSVLKDQRYSRTNVFFYGSLFFDFALIMPDTPMWVTFFNFIERLSGIHTDLIQLFRYVAVFFIFHSALIIGVELCQLVRLERKIEKYINHEDNKNDTEERHD